MKLLRSIALALGLVLVAPFGYAAISLLSGPQDVSQFQATINTIISQVNAQLATYLSTSNTTELGALYLTGPAAFAANGSVATAMSSVGPTGSHTTVQEWVLVINSAGTVRYVPAF